MSNIIYMTLLNYRTLEEEYAEYFATHNERKIIAIGDLISETNEPSVLNHGERKGR